MNDPAACGRKLGAILWLGLMLVVSAVNGSAADRHVLFLVDSSRSMEQNDPRRLTAAACAAAAHLLDEGDQIALWEFDASARPLHSGWLRAGDWNSWLAAVTSISQRGQFTDFRAAFAGAAQHFSTRTEPGRRVLILLTDGVFEPDLAWEGYAPHSLEYGLKRRFSSGAALNREYHDRILPMARRLARTEVEKLKTLEVEIFTIALGSQTETELLNEAARLTAKTPTEQHSFEAAKARDLISVFASVLRYLGPREVLGQVSGRGRTGETLSIAADGWMRDPRILLAADERLAGHLTQDDKDVTVRPSAHESILLAAPPSTNPLSFRFSSDAGPFEALLAAESLYRLKIYGLKAEYPFGDVISGRVLDVVAGPAVSNRQAALMLVPSVGGEAAAIPLRDDLSFAFETSKPGVYRLSARARWKTADGTVVERTSVDHLFEVLPAFSVRPNRLHFGELRHGGVSEVEIVFHSGLTSPAAVRVDPHAPAPDGRAHPEALSFTINPGEKAVRALRLLVPDGAAAGEWEGVLTVSAGNERAEIHWTAHLPSLWERVRWWLLLAILLVFLLLIYLIIVWGRKSGPYGTLLPHGDCPGAIRRPIRLGAVHSGLFRRWLNYRRNEVGFRVLGVPRLPNDLEGVLVFYRWGTVMLSNRSRPTSQSLLAVRDSPAGREMKIVPGRNVRIRHGALIRFGECEYRFENPR